MRSISLCCAIAIAIVASASLSCRRAAPPRPSGPLSFRIIYHEEEVRPGRDCDFVSGEQESVFRNTSSTQSLTIKMPPAEIWEITSNSMRILSQEDWPDFAREPKSFTLAPGEQRVFRAPFEMLRKKPRGRPGPDFRLVFSNESEENGAFTGTVTSENVWDDSETRVIRPN